MKKIISCSLLVLCFCTASYQPVEAHGIELGTVGARRAILCALLTLATSCQPAEARKVADAIKAVGDGAENVVVATGTFATAAAVGITKLLTLAGYGTARAAEEASVFAWDHGKKLLIFTWSHKDTPRRGICWVIGCCR